MPDNEVKTIFTEQTIQDNSIKHEEPDWLLDRRVRAYEFFKQATMPSRKEEDWKYIDLTGLDFSKLDPYTNSVGQSIKANHVKGLIFTDIKTAFNEYPELVKEYIGTVVSPNENKFTALHYALINSGIFLYVPENTEVTLPALHSILTSSTSGLFVHSLIVIGKNARLNFLDESMSRFEDKQALHSEVMEIIIKENAKVNISSLQSWGLNVWNFATKRALLKENSELNWVFSCFGGKFSRINVDTVFGGKGSVSKNLALFLGVGNQNIHINTNDWHNVPNTTYDILMRGVLMDEASAFYRGLIKIDKKAPQTNSMLTEHALILGDKASSTSVPSLEIDNNDVKAGHAASSGQVDESQLFYLMSRGLSQKEAERLIINGFLEPVVRRVEVKEIKDKFEKLIQSRVGYYD